MMSYRTKKALLQTMRYVVLATAFLVVLFPLYWMIITSFKTKLELFATPPTFFPKHIQWANYVEAFQNRPFFTFLINSIIVAFASTFISLSIGTLAAYSLARFKLSGNWNQRIAFWIMSTRMIPPIVTIIPMFLIMKELKLLNTYWALMIVYTGLNLPFVVWMMRAFFREVPEELEEAAMVDGATRMGAFRRVVLPLVAPGLVATAIFCLILTWNEFLFALILVSSNNFLTLPVGIASLVSQFELLWGEMAAAGTVAVIPIIFFSMLVQKKLIRGMTMGAVKG